MLRYITVTKEDLEKLRDGLDIFERLNSDTYNEMDLHLYGLSTDSTILDSASEAIHENGSYDEENEGELDIKVPEVAVAIPLSSDIIWDLLGSGMRIRDEEFCYMGTEGEGVRTGSFRWVQFHPSIFLNKFTELAIAESNSWLDDFLKQYGTKQPMQINKKVTRTEEATQPDVPVTPEATPPPVAPEAAAPPAATPPVATHPARTSSLKTPNIRELLEKFLG